MDKQKEALSRIVGTVNVKYDDAEKFALDLRDEVATLEECYKDSMTELNNQFHLLAECLENARGRMMREIELELCAKLKPLQDRLQNFEDAKSDADDLIMLSNKALEMTNPSEFSQAALRIKDRVTMSPLFRLSLSPMEVEQGCFFVADFSREQRVLNQLRFMPVPSQPEIISTGCFAEDNTVHCVWSAVDDDDHMTTILDSELLDAPVSLYSEAPGQHLPSSIDYFVLQYRQGTLSSQEGPWTTVENIRSFQFDVKGLVFHQPLLQIRLQAWNKAVGGCWSDICSVPTPAFNFAFNPDACHPNLKVVSDDRVEWDPTATKVQETRVRSAASSRSASPVKNVSSSPRRAKTKDRFTGESYTVLGDTVFTDEESYFEVEPHPDCKTYSIGITLKSLARFDQLGRTPTSWCLHVSNWIQNTFVAKHNNKMKNLESTGEVPSRIGVYFNSGAGLLSFYNAETHQAVHTFKQVKCTGPIIPGFLLWFGSMQIHTGIQVPSWIVTRPSTAMNGRSESTPNKSNPTTDTAGSPEDQSLVT